MRSLPPHFLHRLLYPHPPPRLRSPLHHIYMIKPLCPPSHHSLPSPPPPLPTSTVMTHHGILITSSITQYMSQIDYPTSQHYSGMEVDTPPMSYYINTTRLL